MKKALSIILITFFAISCGGSSEPSTDTNVSGTDGSVDTLQPIYDSLQHIEDSLISLDTNRYDERFGKRIQK
jgi:hypothetical protein